MNMWGCWRLYFAQSTTVSNYSPSELLACSIGTQTNKKAEVTLLFKLRVWSQFEMTSIVNYLDMLYAFSLYVCVHIQQECEHFQSGLSLSFSYKCSSVTSSKSHPINNNIALSWGLHTHIATLVCIHTHTHTHLQSSTYSTNWLLHHWRCSGTMSAYSQQHSTLFWRVADGCTQSYWGLCNATPQCCQFHSNDG